jgi:uncharacterized membrane protein
MKTIQKIFVSGLVTFLPIAVTIYIVYAGVSIVENLLGDLLRRIIPTDAYIPGFGFLSTMVLIFLLGLMLNNFVTARLLKWLQEKLTEVPLIKVVYAPLRDLMNLFSKGHQQNALKKVVLVTISEGKQVLGLVTREHFDDVGVSLDSPDSKLAVYIPMSYGLGGYTLLIEKSQLLSVNIPVEKAMSLALTAWIKSEPNQQPRK